MPTVDPTCRSWLLAFTLMTAAFSNSWAFTVTTPPVASWTSFFRHQYSAALCVSRRQLPQHRRKELARVQLVDPVHVVDQIQQLPHDPPMDMLLPSQSSLWPSILSTMLSSTTATSITADPLNGVIITNLHPAHEHSQPFWGPPDPYLTAGKSIPPSVRALQEMGIQKASSTLSSSIPETAASAVAQTTGGSLSVGGADSVAASTAAPTALSSPSARVLPGFAPTHGILPEHNPRVMSALESETAADFLSQVRWSMQLLNVIDKLPALAFTYALFEFFLIRPNLDTYKEDIEKEPMARTLETISVTGVRLGIFVVIAVITLGVFG